MHSVRFKAFSHRLKHLSQDLCEVLYITIIIIKCIKECIVNINILLLKLENGTRQNTSIPSSEFKSHLTFVICTWVLAVLRYNVK